MRLIDWGAAHKILYKPYLAPAEYTTLIAEHFAENEKIAENTKSVKIAETSGNVVPASQMNGPFQAAKLAGQLFEKALYDKNVLTAQEEKDFISSIEAIVKL